jgi:hypothetical protein
MSIIYKDESYAIFVNHETHESHERGITDSVSSGFRVFRVIRG